MNWLLIVTLAVIIGFAIRGYRKGIIKMVISLASMILSVMAAFVLAPIISENLCNSEIVLNHISEWVNEGLGIEESCIDITDNMVNSIKGTGKKDTMSMSTAQKEELIENLTLPEKIKNSMLENTAEIVGTKGKITAINFARAISEYIAQIIIKAITYIAVFIVFKVIFRVITNVFKLVDKLPIIEDINEMVGGVAGAISGLIIVWVGFLFLFLLSTTSLGIVCYQYINDSEILTFLYNNNLLVHWILKSLI